MKREFHVRFCESLGETLGYSTKTPLIGQEFPLKASALGPWGDTPEEAILAKAGDALQSWLKTAKEFGDPIPSPKEKFSGQWRLRLPKSLHAGLAYRAKFEGVSLNAFVATLLAKGLGQMHSHHP
jgi:predicted HicB family RNase H-like nuclease